MDSHFDARFFQTPDQIAGIDEAGRGPWAGPVVAAALMLPADYDCTALNDSKKLTPQKREMLYARLTTQASYGIGMASVAEIDALNILQATYLAMRRALQALPQKPAFLLVDGNRLPPDLPAPAKAIIKGDSLSARIAGASIIAKVTRDRLMLALDKDYPAYGWARNKGYGTKAHREGLARVGISPHHRKSFAPIRALWKDCG